MLALLPEPSTREAMAMLARAQVRRIEETMPPPAGGGQLILATVAQHGGVQARAGSAGHRRILAAAFGGALDMQEG